MRDKHHIVVKISYSEDRSEAYLDIVSAMGRTMKGQDVLDAVAEAILLKWDDYDLTPFRPESLDG